jgi:ankyrin repeat protein
MYFDSRQPQSCNHCNQCCAHMPHLHTRLIHARNWHGFTPLHMACWGRQAAAVQILLQHGADLLAK